MKVNPTYRSKPFCESFLRLRVLVLSMLLLLICINMSAQTDTLRVMTYNVLNYGDYCQGTPDQMHKLLHKIVSVTKPDLLGLVKVQSIKRYASDNYGISPLGFADTILHDALNPGNPGKYAYCTFTNTAADNVMSVLFYNTQKLGFLQTFTLCSLVSDFDLYKLYYKDPDLALHPDTTFLYVLLNYTASGSTSTTRDQQMAACVAGLKTKFYHLPNLISMGDFNLRNSGEAGYLQLVAAADTNYVFQDPPFHPEGTLTYPIDWSTSPSLCSPYLTTSTRFSATLPNSCGTGGGAKSWYDHILLSPWIVNGANYVHYIRGSYQTIGNDGHRLAVSINDSTSVPKNSFAPDSVIEALYGFSNKYPVMLSLELSRNSTGTSLPDPDAVAGIHEPFLEDEIRVSNPVNGEVCLYGLSADTPGDVQLTWFDCMGRELDSATMLPGEGKSCQESKHPEGVYLLRVKLNGRVRFFRVVQL
jgi:hypothetical protein